MINHNLCKTGLTYLPPWPCPACGQGTLQNEKQGIHHWPDKGVVPGIDEGFIERWDDYGVFSASLVCSNPSCRQGVAVLGDYSTSLVDGDARRFEIERTYVVRDIHPAILLIDIPATLTPKPIAGALQRSFALFWRDPQACAVTVRTAIEGIADHLGQPSKQNGRFVSLEIRLNNLDPKHAHIVEAAKAIKDIGNDGAHGDKVDPLKLLSAYELLEIDLREIFNDDAVRRQALITKLRS